MSKYSFMRYIVHNKSRIVKMILSASYNMNSVHKFSLKFSILCRKITMEWKQNLIFFTWKSASCLFGSNFSPNGFSWTRPCLENTLSKYLWILTMHEHKCMKQPVAIVIHKVSNPHEQLQDLVKRKFLILRQN